MIIFSKFSGWLRALLCLSVLWILGAFVYSGPWYRSPSINPGPLPVRNMDYINWGKFLLIGVLPLVVVWGIIWVIQGFRDTRFPSNQKSQEERRKELDKKALF